jgi:hypothetical protein
VAHLNLPLPGTPVFDLWGNRQAPVVQHHPFPLYPVGAAGVAKLATAPGLGPGGAQAPWGFKSLRPHLRRAVAIALVALAVAAPAAPAASPRGAVLALIRAQDAAYNAKQWKRLWGYFSPNYRSICMYDAWLKQIRKDRAEARGLAFTKVTSLQIAGSKA